MREDLSQISSEMIHLDERDGRSDDSSTKFPINHLLGISYYDSVDGT